MSNSLAAFSGIPFSPAALAKPKQNLDRGYAPRLQLVSTGTSGLVEKGVGIGSYAIVDGDNCVDVGNDLVIIPLARLDKAVDFSDSNEVVSAFGEDTEEYQRIQAECEANGYDSGCMYGPLFLCFEVSTCQFVELFCNNKSSRNEAERLNAFLPISKEAAEQYNVDPRAPQPVSLTSKKVGGKGKRKNTWYVPVATAHEGPLEVAEPPAKEDIAKACQNFVKQSIVEEEDRDR